MESVDSGDSEHILITSAAHVNLSNSTSLPITIRQSKLLNKILLYGFIQNYFIIIITDNNYYY